ncbi:hypothetical protein ACOSP7_022805 [Xanthoceras sorbifolium]
MLTLSLEVEHNNKHNPCNKNNTRNKQHKTKRQLKRKKKTNPTSYLLGSGGGVLECRREYWQMTDDSILSMFRLMVFIWCPNPIMFSSITSKQEVRPLTGLDPAHAPSLHHIPGRLEAPSSP